MNNTEAKTFIGYTMTRILCMIAALILPTPHARADDEKIFVQILGADVRDVLHFYSNMTNRRLWVTLDLRADVTLTVEGKITKAEAARFIRDALLERYGIDLRDSGDNEAFATWSENPKYQNVRAAADRMKIRVPKLRITPDKPEEQQK